ncbi:cell adhesion molecule 2-like [Panulirus ornatus]|uniref:cell adhesion molecule 2-like n=1 Tax=Panulirus ornatus TaxID=150431 RepID=UPI003A8C1928
MGWRRRWSLSWMLPVIAFLVQGSSTIRITRVRVPPTLEVGGQGDLDCTWQEDNDQMYSIKWYQGAHEFYRYTPTARNPVQIFDPPTLDVDREKSWGGSVRIANVSLAAEGPFHCEVSADGPTFHTASDAATVKIVDLPDGGPVIKGLRSHYLPGDWVDLTCVSRRSRPAPRLSFTINNQPASPGWLEPQGNQMDHEGLTTSSLQLRFSLRPRLLQDGDALVRCVSEIPGIHQQVTEEVITTRHPYHASVLGGGAAPEIRPALASHAVCLVLPLLLSAVLPHI